MYVRLCIASLKSGGGVDLSWGSGIGGWVGEGGGVCGGGGEGVNHVIT